MKLAYAWLTLIVFIGTFSLYSQFQYELGNFAIAVVVFYLLVIFGVGLVRMFRLGPRDWTEREATILIWMLLVPVCLLFGSYMFFTLVSSN